MQRVDTIESDKIWNELKSFENSINWDGNSYIGNSNKVKFALTPAMSTRTIYVKIGDWNGNQTEIRISDHNPSWKANQKDVYLTFETFDLNLIKEIYNNYN
jgi:hypothetical protein